jgi:hypothetical protein
MHASLRHGLTHRCEDPPAASHHGATHRVRLRSSDDITLDEVEWIMAHPAFRGVSWQVSP